MKVSTKKRKRIRKKAYKFVSSISVLGIARIVKSDNTLVKLVWTIMTLISVSFGLYNISKSFTDYYRYDVITNIERITPINVTFPAITICSTNYVNKKTWINGTYSGKETTYLGLENFISYSDFKSLELNTTELESFNIPKEIGNCLRFSGMTKINTVNDTNDEFYIRLSRYFTEYVNVNLYHEYDINYVYYDVYIVDNFKNSYLNINPLKLSNDKTYLITFEKLVIEKRLNTPRSPCLEFENRVYHQQNCIEDCINKGIEDKYNCSFPSFYQTEGLKQCGNQSDLFYFNYIKKLADEFYNNCEKKCPQECDATQFKIKIENIQNLAYSEGIAFTFRFSDLSSLEIIQIPKMNSFDLVSNVGGLLGLFIGITFLSFVEVLELIIDVFYVLFV